MIRVECQYCDCIIEVPKSWAIKNGRLFCNSCCKAMDIMIESKEEHKESEEKKNEEVNPDYLNGDWDFGF